VTRRTEALALTVVVLASCLPYASSVAFGFTFDDANTILGHHGVAGPLAFDDLILRDFWGRSFIDTIGSWRPVVTLTYWVEWHLAGGRPWLFHADNVALYGAVLALYAVFLKRFFGTALGPVSRLVAVGAAGALAIHSDVVPSATGRSEILAALFGLLGLLAPLREEGPVRLREVACTAGAGVLAAAAKESALPLALLAPLLAYRWHAARGTDRREGMVALTAASALGLAGVVAFRVLRMPWWSMGPERATENALIAAGPGPRLLGSGEVLGGYLGRAAWPARLAPDYSYAGIVPGHSPALAAAGFTAAAVLLAVGVAHWKRGPGLSDAAVGFAASYVVVSSTLVAASAIADRLFFFPSLWVMTLAALGAERMEARWRKVAGAVAAGFACAQGWVAFIDVPRWRDDVTLFTAAIDARPTVARSRRNLAQALADAGRVADAAWQMTVVGAILDRYPAPIPEGELPARWEQEPVEARLSALRLQTGAPAVEADMRRGAAMFRHWGNDDAAALLEAWAGARP
jgi:hypothetical protein